MEKRYRGWCFTLNNYSDEEEGFIQEIPFDSFRYLVYGKEIGDDKKTPHLQGFVLFSSMKSLSQVKKFLGTDRVHLEPQRGTSIQAASYCKKDGNFVELGLHPPQDPSDQGPKGREFWQEQLSHAKDNEIDKCHPEVQLRLYSALIKIRDANIPKPQPISELDFWWFVGPSGSGKSKTAREENPDAYLKDINKWWDSYDGEDCVLIDEWGPSDERLHANQLKKWCDHHPFSAEVKGGRRVLRPKKIVVTSNWTIEECFLEENNLLPILRRFRVRRFPEEKKQK